MHIQSIGSYEAKTHLAELLRKVQTGDIFEISVRGKPVARLIPAESADQKQLLAVANMRAFMQQQLTQDTGAGLDLRALIEDGRA